MAKPDPNMTNEEVLNQIADPEALAEFKDFEEEQISFPPYWEADEGKWFYAIPVMLDDRDKNFVRYVCQALMPMTCAQGSKKGKEADYKPIKVEKDEYFTLSAYGGLPLERYIGVKVLVKCTGQRDVGQPQPMWTFKLKVSPEDKKLLTEDRKKLAAVAIQRFRESRQLSNNRSLPAKGDAVPFD